MILFIERGIQDDLSDSTDTRGPTTSTCNRIIIDPSKPSSYLMYYDVNNLYGWAMCQPLPYVDFRWVHDTSNFNVMDIALDSSTGYILEVDLEYPQHLHNAHTDLPFCPTHDKSTGKR